MSPELLALTGTIAVFAAADWLHRKTGGHPFAHPVLLSIVVIGGTLLALNIPYATYFEGARFIHFLLGPATVALALPLYRHWEKVRASALPLGVTLLIGSILAMGAGAGLAWAAGGSDFTLRALLPKSATAPVAMELSDMLGSEPSLTAALVILTGTIGAAFGPWLLKTLKIEDDRAKGFALGLASHGIGTAQAFRISPVAGVFASLGMGLNALMTTALVAGIVVFL